jgi:hypothetical protein
VLLRRNAVAAGAVPPTAGSERLQTSRLRELRFWFVAHGAVSLRLPLSARSGSRTGVTALGVIQQRATGPSRRCVQVAAVAGRASAFIAAPAPG